MIKLYYTVSSGEDATQEKAQLSLGGYRSATLVESGNLNNLFGDISLLTIKKFNRNQYIGLVLFADAAATNVKLWTEIPEGSYSNLNLSVVSMAEGTDGFKQMESVSSVNSKPLLSDFQSYTEDEPFEIGDMILGGMYGLWIERILDITTATADQQDVYETDPTNSSKYVEKEKETEDEILIGISWD